MSQNLIDLQQQTIEKDDNNNWIPQPSTNILRPPQIIECSLLQGKQGDSLRIDIRQQDLTMDVHLLRIAFHSRFTICQISLNTVTQVFSIHAQVPDSNFINFDLSKVPIYLVVVQEHTVIDSWLVGYFCYVSSPTKKRSSSDPDTNNEPKRQKSDQQQQSHLANYYVSVPYVGLPPTHPSPRSNDYFEDPLINIRESNRPASAATTNTVAFSEPNFFPARPSALHTEGQSSFIVPILDPQPSSQIKSIQPVLSPSNLEQSVSPPLPSTNPFTHVVNKPNLILQGDLSSMTLNWTETERRNQRRIVQFWRRQIGNDIICRFEPFFQQFSTDTSRLILVSCICWQNEYYVTSVDCISLLERLIGIKFTVEEKNRIRRNLEEYRPKTVNKVNSLEFFRLIMGFPHPKPRNIEKGVKVFPWQTLSIALNKIITKYTASYSSTASITE